MLATLGMLGPVLSSIYRNNVTEDLESLVQAQIANTIGESLGSLGSATSHLAPEIAATVASLADQAFVDAMRISLYTAIGFVAIAIALIAIPRNVREHQA